jgi:small subunit ribosomal protein S3
MGHKTSPIGFRIGVIEPWRSRWYTRSKPEMGKFVIEDSKIRKLVRKSEKCRDAGVSRVEIERMGDLVRVILVAARPGALVGKRGVRAGQLEEELTKLTKKRIEVVVRNIENVMLDAQLVADSLAGELERRVPHKRLMHKYAENIMNEGAKGVKLMVKGRLGGAEIARDEHLTLGKVPMQTLMAEISYATSTAHLSKGTIGVKVWIYRRDRRLEDAENRAQLREAAAANAAAAAAAAATAEAAGATGGGAAAGAQPAHQR